MEIFFCPDCGEDVPASAGRCRHCGRRFRRVPWKAVAAVAVFLLVLGGAVAAILYDLADVVPSGGR
jgi:ribosomal protein L40E